MPPASPPLPSPPWLARAFTTAARHYQAGLHDQARQLLILTLERQPDHADSMYLLASIAAQAGDSELAEGLLRQAIAIESRKTPYWILLGNLLQRGGRLEESAECYKMALSLDPNCADAYYNWGNTLERQGRNREATEFFEHCARLEPRHVQARNNLANQYRRGGRFKEAAAQLEAARRLDPQSMPVVLNLGNVHMDNGEYDKALACFEQAIAMMPALAVLYNNKGNALRNLRRIPEALDAYGKAIELEPRRAEFHVNRGSALQTQGRLQEALDAFRHALELAPEVAAAHGAALFTLHYDPRTSTGELLEAHREWARRHTRGLGRAGRPFPNRRNPDKRLRIGYVSADFRRHPVAYFVAPVFAAHDRGQVEVYCYSGAVKSDDWTARVRKSVDQWRDAASMSDLELAARIGQDGIDILVDLAGHTAGNRLEAFARKPAPVQMSWLGYFNTTGMEAMDYLVVDKVICPEGGPAPYVEQPLRLDGCYLAYRGPDYAPPVTPPPACGNGYVTYGCFNTPSKVTADVLRLWARLLRADPAARLMLKNAVLDDPLSQKLCREALEGEGVASGRVTLAGQSPHRELLAAYAGVDVALDPFPYNGGTTTCEALWMGVPVVTLAGGWFVSRVGETILRHAGRGEWVAHSQDEYVRIALALGENRERLRNIRAGLRRTVRNSLLGDTKGFTRRWEDALRVAWKKWCGAPREF
ncbi:MAG: Photosystem I assembly protein Ycf3 [Anaerolineales bacterium]|nr:Photosystem I assembly protein Ycf3 [Anaerolineales bacterium]